MQTILTLASLARHGVGRVEATAPAVDCSTHLNARRIAASWCSTYCWNSAKSTMPSLSVRMYQNHSSDIGRSNASINSSAKSMYGDPPVAVILPEDILQVAVCVRKPQCRQYSLGEDNRKLLAVMRHHLSTWLPSPIMHVRT